MSNSVVGIELKAPARVELEMTWKCNHRCFFCYNKRLISKRGYGRQVSDYLRLIDELGKAEVFGVTLTGGEPFCDKNKLFRLVERLDENEIFYSINTNASLIEEDDLPFLRKASFLVSFHGFGEYKKITGVDDRGRTLENIRLLKERGKEVLINFVVNQYNIHEIEKAHRYFRGVLGLPISFSRMGEPACVPIEAKLPKDYPRIIQRYNARFKTRSLLPIPLCSLDPSIPARGMFGCSGGFLSCAIGENGRIRTCIHSPKEGADVFKVGFLRAWKSLSGYRRSFRLPPECGKCVYVSQCGGGCRVLAYLKTGSFSGKDPLMGKPIKEAVYNFGNEKIRFGRKKIHISPDIKFRKESFGWLIGGRFSNAIPVNNSGRDLLLSCEGKGIEELKESGMKSEELKRFFIPFVRAGLVNLSGEKPRVSSNC